MTMTSPTERVLDVFAVASEPGNERLALARVAEAVADCGLSGDQLERLKTAVAEATMNAIEHGNGNRPELDVDIEVLASDSSVVVAIADHGGDRSVGQAVELPDLDKKLAGLQTPRGWGLFLIQNMVDAMDVSTDGPKHTVRLTMRTPTAPAPREAEGGPHADQV